MKQDFIERLFKHCISNNPEESEEAISNLENLIDRHTTNKYEDKEYENVFISRKELSTIRLEAADMQYISYFLFYLLFNFPDRSTATARCLVKTYDKSIVEGLC